MVVHSWIVGGANGGMLGSDVWVLSVDEVNKIDVSGVGDQVLTNLPLAQGATVVETVHDGPVVLILSQYALRGEGSTIHSKAQVEHFGNLIHARTRGKWSILRRRPRQSIFLRCAPGRNPGPRWARNKYLQNMAFKGRFLPVHWASTPP